MMKRKVTACLLAGVLVLGVSAGAAYDSVNGYASLKNGVKQLALYTDNVTAEANYTVSVDGKPLQSVSTNCTLDGSDWLTQDKSTMGDETRESWSFCYQGEFATASSAMIQTKHYNGWKVEDPRQNLININTDEELAQRMITFAELAADTAMGDLKNTFVALGKEDGISRYQVDISKSQVPAVVNAGLSLIAYSATQDDFIMSGSVEYEDFDASFCAYFAQETGYPLTREEYQRLWDEQDPDTWTQEERERSAQITELHERYYTENDMARQKKGGGVLLIRADNSQVYYETGQDYYAAVDSARLVRFTGPEATLEKVHCVFGVDSEGRLSDLTLSAVFSSVDMKGEAHTLEVTAGLTTGEFGTTVVQVPDLTGWNNLSAHLVDTENAETAEVTA